MSGTVSQDQPADDRRPLRVAYILHRFPYLTETFIVRELHGLRADGAEPTIFSLMAPKHTTASPRALELVPLARYAPVMSGAVAKAQLHYLRRRPLRYLKAFSRLIWQTYREPKVMLMALALFPKSVYFAREIETSHIDHVHAHFVWLEGLAAGVAKDLTGVSISAHPHAFGLFGRNQRNVRRQLENASKIVTISEYHRRYIADLSPRIPAAAIDVVHCGIEPERIDPPAQRRLHEPPRILSVGRAIPKKGHEHLVDACAELAKRNRAFSCQILIGGAGRSEPLKERIDSHGIAGQVTLLGARDEDAVLDLLSTSDVFVLACVVAESGDRDGIPVSLMEAMASEMPVVTTPVAGIPELVQHDVTGVLTGERDAVGLADAIERLLDDADLRTELGKRGRAIVLEEFNAADSARRMGGIFRRLSTRQRSIPLGGS